MPTDSEVASQPATGTSKAIPPTIAAAPSIFKANSLTSPRAATTLIRHHLTTKDIKRLQPRQWLNDDLITFGIRMIQEKFIIPHRVTTFSTYFMEKIQRDGLPTIVKWHARIPDPASQDILLFPTHIHGNHWYLLAVIIYTLGSSKTASLFILDSLGSKGDHKMHADSVLCYLHHYWPHLKLISVHSSKVPQQSNTFDCGICVLHFCKVLCMQNLQMSLRVLKGDRHLNTEDIASYWNIKEVSQIRSWLLQCVEDCVP